MRRLRILIVLLTISLAVVEAANRPKLIVFLSVDQMKAEYFEWYRTEYSGGLRRLSSEGTVYANATLNYAPSETGPGHASLSTGVYPARNGIIANEWSVPGTTTELYCVADSAAGMVHGEGGGVSPRNLLVSGLGDWLKKSSPASRVFTASIKDRAAILMGGKHPDGAFWYSPASGHMVTSAYYMHELPVWVERFNAERWPERNVPDAWQKLRPDSIYAKYGPDDQKGETPWENSRIFPHPIAADKKSALLARTPYGDQMILDFARTIVREEKLGQRGTTDLLCISLSCTDYIGHAFGGNSHEMIDQLIRLDRALGAFMTDMELAVGGGEVLFVLSADHASMPLPEYLADVKHMDARRIIAQNDVTPNLAELEQELQKEFGTSERLIRNEGVLNYRAAAAAGVDSIAFERKVREGVLKISGIADIVFRREILSANGSGNRYLASYQRGYYPPRGSDFILRPREYCLLTWSPTGTTHGTPYAYDTHVPMIFWGSGVKAASITRTVHTVDIAPTVARLLGIKTPSNLDGKALKEIAR